MKDTGPRATKPYTPGYEIMFQTDRKSLPWSWAKDRLSSSHNYWLATSRTDGKPHVMPVWGIWLDNEFYFSTGRRSRKSRNLSMNPNCVVCPETASQAVIMEGVAREVKDSNLLQRFGAVYRKKYDWDMGNLENSKDPIYAIRPMTVFGFVENSKRIKGNPTRWKLTRRPRPKKT